MKEVVKEQLQPILPYTFKYLTGPYFNGTLMTKDIQLEMYLIYNYDTLEVAHDTD